MKKMNKKIIIPLFILILCIGIAIIYGSQLLGKVNNVEIPKVDKELDIKEEVVEKEKPEINNILLFGLDKRSPLEKGRSDTIMIVSLDKQHKKIKLTSIMRDTYVDIPGRGMDKINHAYAFGGPELAIKTVNQNFDMNIRDFATVDFVGLEHIIDTLGGVEVDIKQNEVSHIPGSHTGTQILDGKQALAYSRIRKTGNGDYERTERQRVILEKVINKGINSGVIKYPKLINTILQYVDTSLSKSEILKLGTSSINADIRNVEQFRIPVDKYAKGQMINNIYYLVPDTLEDNVEFLHKFIYEK